MEGTSILVTLEDIDSVLHRGSGKGKVLLCAPTVGSWDRGVLMTDG